MAGATVRLLSEDGETDWTRNVDENGDFLFDGVMPGTYQVTYQYLARAYRHGAGG